MKDGHRRKIVNKDAMIDREQSRFYGERDKNEVNKMTVPGCFGTTALNVDLH